MLVKEAFFSVEVGDMERASTFYVQVFGATIAYASARWSSLIIAGVRLGLVLKVDHAGEQIGLHFAVDDLDSARDELKRAGGTARGPRKMGPDLLVLEVTDTEGNTFLLTQAEG